MVRGSVLYVLPEQVPMFACVYTHASITHHAAEPRESDAPRRERASCSNTITENTLTVADGVGGPRGGRRARHRAGQGGRVAGVAHDGGRRAAVAVGARHRAVLRLRHQRRTRLDCTSTGRSVV